MNKLLKLNGYSVNQLITLQNRDLLEILQNFYGNIQKSLNSMSSGQDELIQNLILSVINSKNSIKYSEKFILELSYKIHFKILQLSNKNDDRFYSNIQNFNSIDKSLILLAILETNYCINYEYSNIKEIAINLFHESILNNKNSYVILINLKILNLIYKRYLSLNNFNIEFEYLYYCLQSNTIGVREESIILTINLMKNYQNSCKYLKILLDFCPWTNRIKFFVLSAILTNYKLKKFCDNSIIDKSDINYNIMFGIKLSLSHKNLFSVGQMLIKTLDKQQEYEIINELVYMIIKNCKLNEVKNLYTQWQRIITQKEHIFDKLNLNESWKNIQNNLDYKFLFENEDKNHNCNEKSSKFPLILNIFTQQIIKHKDFNDIVMYLKETCFQYSLETQLYTYIFILDIANVIDDFENILIFLRNFLKAHMNISNVEIRQTIINKIPQLFDLLSRKYSKSIQRNDKSNDSNENYILEFFKELISIIEKGLLNKEYQTLIYSLKILEILNKTYFQENDKQIRITKNSNIKFNQILGKKIIEKRLYIKENLQKQLFEILNCLECRYDDIYDIIIIILQQMKLSSNFENAFNLCKISNSNPLIDYCSLSTFYTRIYLNSSSHLSLVEKNEYFQEFYEYCIQNIKENQNKIKNDPLKTCKNGEHLFGYINSLNEFFIYNNFDNIQLENIYNIIDMIESINVMLLKMLNEASNCSSYAPSFQIMDESLEILIKRSCINVENNANDKKFLLLSFWMTLKACCDLATTIGIQLNSIVGDNETHQIIEYLEKCVLLNVEVLSKCRHKGAIEAAGLSLGKLVKSITSQHTESSKIYQILFDCFTVLFENVNEISLTRRGAGLSIMFHHLLKNESNKDHPLFSYAIKKILNYEQRTVEINNDENNQSLLIGSENEQYENFNALVLHYLCVIVKDTELKEYISEYFDEIMMATMQKIEDNDWRVRNAALQLFGALVPKIIGQKQILFENSWTPIEFTFSDAFIKLPITCEYVIKYFSKNLNEKTFTTSSLISFLEFFSNVEYIRIDNDDDKTQTNSLHLDKIEKFKSLFWSFLSYKYEKVRKLAARCIARIHDFHFELIKIIEKCIEIIFKKKLNENFRHGLLLCILECYYKMKFNIKLIRNFENDFNLNDKIRIFFYKYYQYQNFSFYIKLELINFFKIFEFNFDREEILQILFSNQNATKNNIKEIFNEENSSNFYEPGYKIWKENILEIYKFSF